MSEFKNIKKFFDNRLYEVEKRLDIENKRRKQLQLTLNESIDLCANYETEIKELKEGWEVLLKHG